MDEVAILRGLVEAYSPSDREAPAVKAFVKVGQSLGLATHVDAAGNGFARRGSGRPQVMLLGHIDTVEGELPVRVEKGRLLGRGACDAKGALAAALVAASRYTGPGEVLVVAAVGEEKDSRGARYLIPRHRPDFLIVGEPSGWEGVTIGYKGNLSLVVRFKGERTHLSSPAATTVETALAFVERLRGFCWDHRGETPYSSLTAKVHTVQTTREGGRETVELGINVRLPRRLSTAAVIQFLEENDLAGRYRVLDRSEAVEVPKDNAVVRALLGGIRGAGGSPRLLRKAGTADLNLALPVWGCPAAVYGPGDAHLDHTDEEGVALAEYARSIRVLEDALPRLTRRGGVAGQEQRLGRPGRSRQRLPGRILLERK